MRSIRYVSLSGYEPEYFRAGLVVCRMKESELLEKIKAARDEVRLSCCKFLFTFALSQIALLLVSWRLRDSLLSQGFGP